MKVTSSKCPSKASHDTHHPIFLLTIGKQETTMSTDDDDNASKFGNSTDLVVLATPIPDLTGSGYQCDFDHTSSGQNMTSAELMKQYGSNAGVETAMHDICTCCPEGYYCPVTYTLPVPGTTVIKCPSGSFCPSGSIAPRKCYFLQICNKEGLKMPEHAPSAVACFFFICFLFGVIPIICEYIRLWQRSSLREKKAAEKALVMEQRNKHDKEQMEILKKQQILLSLFSAGSSNSEGDYVSTASVSSVSPEEYDVVCAGVKRKMRLWALRARVAVMRRAKLTDVFKVNPDKEKVLLSFRDICVFGSSTTTRMTADGPKRVTNKKFYLNNATGFIRPGRVTALMGPSGCGKSTLISALSDRVAADMFSGDIFMNDDIVSPSLVNNVCGFVPQEDIMNSDLTVKENLFYICALRHDPKSPLGNGKNRRKLINELLHAMGLNKVRHSVIGGGAKRGISGGQKKRVNIAMELMHDPQVIFMDEPTSGLDASMSCEFLDFMRHMAIATGVSVVMVIHQPNSDTFQKVDDVILMQPTDEGGRIAYCGPVNRGVTYLSSQILRAIEPYENAADRFIDILSKGSPQKDRHTGEHIEKEDGVLLADVYDDDFKASGELWKDVAGVVEPPTSAILSSSQILSVRKKYKRKGPSFPMVALNGGVMFLNMQMNNLAHIIINDATISILCIVLSLMNMKINQLLFVANLLFGLVSGLYGASIFKDYALLKRYKASGINTLALFVGIVTASIPRILLQNAAFNIPFKNINTPLIPGAHLFELTFLGQMTAYCVGMIFCILFPMGGADVNTVMGTLILWVFSGLNPPTSDLDDSAAGVAGMAMSFCHWMLGSELIMAAESQPMCNQTVMAYALQDIGFIPEDSLNTTTPIFLNVTLQHTETGDITYFPRTFDVPVYLNGLRDYHRYLNSAIVLFVVYLFLAGTGFWQSDLLSTIRYSAQEWGAATMARVQLMFASCSGFALEYDRGSSVPGVLSTSIDPIGKEAETRSSEVKSRRSTLARKKRQSATVGEGEGGGDMIPSPTRKSSLHAVHNPMSSSPAVTVAPARESKGGAMEDNINQV